MTCSVDGCSRAAEARGWCRMHYRRWQRTGDPLITRKLSKAPNRECAVRGCTQPYHANGLCAPHDRRRRYHGDPLAGGPVRIIGDRAVRFWSHVAVGDGDACWPWTGSVTPNGYGQFFDGRLVAAHRIAVELTTGHPVPENLDVDHTCHNGSGCAGGPSCLHRRCCNPAHLESVTHVENVMRGNRFVRTGPAGAA